jgi:hypothetical protein
MRHFSQVEFDESRARTTKKGGTRCLHIGRLHICAIEHLAFALGRSRRYVMERIIEATIDRYQREGSLPELGLEPISPAVMARDALDRLPPPDSPD